MITNMLMKFGVVAIAAFGAFAFNGNANAQQEFTRHDTCESISAGCSESGNFVCTIKVDNETLPIDVYDFNCSEEIMNFVDEAVQWSPTR